MAHYLDTSALVELVVAEAETEALRAWLSVTESQWVSCDLTRTELMRAVRRAAPDRSLRAREVLDSVILLDVATSTFEAAGRIAPNTLRTVDAIHLAAALDLGDDLEAIVTYDDRLSEAAASNGIATVAPR